jgi:hypothetical protein
MDQLAQAIVLPKGRRPDEDHRRMKDVHHLVAHWKARHDYFVTKDDAIVKKQARLRLTLVSGL